MKETPILVTGIHRSGSTFLGKMLTLNRGIAYLQEPFNRYYGLNIIDARFKYLTEQNTPASFREAIENLINLKKATYNITSVTENEKVIVTRTELMGEMMHEATLKDLPKYAGKLIFRTEGQLQFEIAKYNPFVRRILLKDPEACFASRFLHEHYDMSVVMLIRHPLSFAASLKRVGWRFDFNNFLQQPQLMEDYLEEFRAEMEELNKDSTVIEEAGMLWNCVYRVVADMLRRHPDYIAVRHRQLAQEPVETIKNLYQQLGLSFTKKVENTIIDHTSSKNPGQAEKDRVHHLKRNSAKIPDNWKKILTNEEADYIRKKTQKIADIFYN
ncbi:MAG TPA: sulfotransferase [Balneolaceae bacterium]|nr:sulfotransferase [Balneolaceae bacterium]